jgi:hypothetical protein
MDAGVGQENGAAQDITFKVNPGEVFVVPQGLLHHNHNAQYSPNVFLQSFTSSDPGALNVIGALAAMGAGSDAGAAAILASGAESIEASPEGAFALDQACLKKCGFPATGAPGDGLADLPLITSRFSLALEEQRHQHRQQQRHQHPTNCRQATVSGMGHAIFWESVMK